MDALLTLKEVAPLVRLTLKSAQHACKAGRFPIRFVAERPYRFTAADVQAFVERGDVTNPILKARTSRYFQGAHRKAS